MYNWYSWRGEQDISKGEIGENLYYRRIKRLHYIRWKGTCFKVSIIIKYKAQQVLKILFSKQIQQFYIANKT